MSPNEKVLAEVARPEVAVKLRNVIDENLPRLDFALWQLERLTEWSRPASERTEVSLNVEIAALDAAIEILSGARQALRSAVQGSAR